MVELEREKTYLLKELPKDLSSCRFEIIRDAFVPSSVEHPILRVRQRGDRCEITKKEPVTGTDSSRQEEHTIKLTQAEFEALAASDAKRFAKRRYYCEVAGHRAEVDIYFEALEGLALIDFEFEDDEAMEAFVMPEICLADVTQEKMFAGGILAGKSYQDLQPTLDRYNYKPLIAKE